MKPLVKLVLVTLFVVATQGCNAQEQTLPKGLRFDIQYRPWFLEGVPHEPVEYIFKMQLTGEADALKDVRSVKYQLPSKESLYPRITHRNESVYYIEGSIPAKDSAAIIAVIRMKSGKWITHTIPLKPR